MEVVAWQLYWPKWYRLYPSWVTLPADEYGPKERWFFFGPLQVRTVLWRVS